MQRIITPKRETERKTINLKVSQATAKALSELKARIRRNDDVTHSLDEALEQQVLRVIERAGRELDEYEAEANNAMPNAAEREREPALEA